VKTVNQIVLAHTDDLTDAEKEIRAKLQRLALLLVDMKTLLETGRPIGFSLGASVDLITALQWVVGDMKDGPEALANLIQLPW
jgi:hypothetical protein